MEQGQLNWIANFIWGIADDVLRDLYVRGKYRDVILPMTVLRRLDAVLETTKQAVLDMKASLDKPPSASPRSCSRPASHFYWVPALCLAPGEKTSKSRTSKHFF
jgi:type I restriction-modification system DNA methylase subunit